MSNKQEKWHISKSINISVLITLALCTISTIVYVTNIDYKVNATNARLDTISKSVSHHHNSTAEHMPYPKKIETFITRLEYNKDSRNIQKELEIMTNTQKEIKSDIKQLLRKVK